MSKRPADNSSRELEFTNPKPRETHTAGALWIHEIADAVAYRLEYLTDMKTRLMDVRAAAVYLGMTEDAIRHKAGIDIPCVRIDGKLRFDRRDLDRWIDRAPRQGI